MNSPSKENTSLLKEALLVGLVEEFTGLEIKGLLDRMYVNEKDGFLVVPATCSRCLGTFEEEARAALTLVRNSMLPVCLSCDDVGGNVASPIAITHPLWFFG